jgi:hypothetical protein
VSGWPRRKGISYEETPMEKLLQMVSFGWLAFLIVPAIIVLLLVLVGAAVSRWVEQ